MNKNINNHPKLREYNQTIEKLINDGLYQQATVTCRLGIEYMVNQYVIEYNQSLNLCNTLYEKITGLNENDFISNNWMLISSDIRKIVNDGGAHDNTLSTNHNITKEEATNAKEKLFTLENMFLESVPSVSTKEINEKFKNKQFEKDEIIKHLENNPNIFNIEKPHVSYNDTWYTFYFKVKATSNKKLVISVKCSESYGVDGNYYIAKLNAKKQDVIRWINNYLKLITENNKKTIKELDAIYAENQIKHEEELKQKEQKENEQRIQQELAEANRKSNRPIIGAFIVILFVLCLIVANSIQQTKKEVLQEKQDLLLKKQEEQKKILQKEQEEEQKRQEEIKKLENELMNETIEFDINYVEGADSIYTPVVLNENQCGGNGDYVDWVENGEKFHGRKDFYYKPTDVLYDEEAIDFIKRIEILFLDDFNDDGLYKNGVLDTDNYYYVVVKFSVDDSNYSNYLGEGTTINTVDMVKNYLENRDDKNWKDVDNTYYRKAFFYKLSYKHKLGDGVYPVYSILKFEKEYTNYNYVYDMSSGLNGFGWFPAHYMIEIYKHFQ